MIIYIMYILYNFNFYKRLKNLFKGRLYNALINRHINIKSEFYN